MIIGKHFSKLFKKIKFYISKPKFFAVFGCLWMITNGWAYLFLVFGNDIMKGIGGAWAAFLWMPFTPEKIILVPLSAWIYKKIFKEDLNEK